MSALLLQTARKSRSLWASSFTRLYAAAAVPEATTTSSVGTGKVDGKVLHPSCVLRRIVPKIARTSSSYYATSPRVGLSSAVSKPHRSPEDRLTSAIAAYAAMADTAGVWRSSSPSSPRSPRSPRSLDHRKPRSPKPPLTRKKPITSQHAQPKSAQGAVCCTRGALQ